MSTLSRGLLYNILFEELGCTLPYDKPYPGYLLLKLVNLRPLHVVFAQDSETGNCIVITCYEPDPGIWRLGFKEKND